MRRDRAIQWLYQELPDLVRQGVVSSETAMKLRRHYGEPCVKGAWQKVLSIFSIFGVLCVGLGVILVFAYNWDAMTRGQKIGLAFVPLVLSQGLLVRFRRKGGGSLAQREGLPLFNMFSTGAALALIGQIYHIPGDFQRFLLTWMMLSLPLAYLFSSHVVAGFYIVGLTVWTVYQQVHHGPALLFWPLTGLMAPYCWRVFRSRRTGPVSIWLSSVTGLCLVIGTGTILKHNLPRTGMIVYSALCAIFYFAYVLDPDGLKAGWVKPFRYYGLFGLVGEAYMLTYKEAWRYLAIGFGGWGDKAFSWEAWASYGMTTGLLGLAIGLLLVSLRRGRYMDAALGAMPVLVVVGYSLAVGGWPEVGFWMFNLYLMILGGAWVIVGIRSGRYGCLNGGILVLGALIFARFSDVALGIMERGCVFIGLGMGMIVLNRFLSKKIQKEA